MIDAPIQEAQGTIRRILTLTSKAGMQLLFWAQLARPLLLSLATAAEPSLLWIWRRLSLRQREPWWHTNHQ
jgi:alpha-D-ribose 1-methylphosphonate 5-triphosphate synthase subunit PhnH